MTKIVVYLAMTCVKSLEVGCRFTSALLKLDFNSDPKFLTTLRTTMNLL